MTFAALVGIHNIVCSSQYVRLQALQKIAKKKSFAESFHFLNTFGALHKNKTAVLSNMDL